MNKSERRPPRSRLPSYAMLAAPMLVAIASLVVIVVWPPHKEGQPQAQSLAASPAPAPYVSSDPSLPRPGTYTLPSEASDPVDGF